MVAGRSSRLAHVVALTLLRAARCSAAASGHFFCPCIDYHATEVIGFNASADAFEWGEDFVVSSTAGALYANQNYGPMYGLMCGAHDDWKPMACNNASSKPSWCLDAWCYVDPDTCSLRFDASTFKPGVRLAYSYETCQPGINQELTDEGWKNVRSLWQLAFIPALLFLILFFGGRYLLRRMSRSKQEKDVGSSAIDRVVARLELAVKADRQVIASVATTTFAIAWVLIFGALGPTVMYDFDLIKNEAVLPPALGDRLYYRSIFPFGFCILILALRPADKFIIYLIRLLIATTLSAATPLFAYLAHVWYGPANLQEQFGATSQSARIFIGGDDILASSYAALGIISSFGSLYLFFPFASACFQRFGGHPLPPSRLLLLQLWRVVRVQLFLIALIFFVQDMRMLARNPRYAGSRAFGANITLCATCLVAAAIVTERNRRRFTGLLGNIANKKEVRSLAALSTIIGSHNAHIAVNTAAKAFRGLPFSKMGVDDWTSNEDTGLNQHTVELQPGECDAFITHSWRDDGNIKWSKLIEWKAHWEEVSASEGDGGREPIVWLDKACIDQNSIATSLSGLPMFVAWSKSLVILASSSYVERLWCIMELFTWVEMGCKIDAIKIYDIDGGASLDEDLSKFKVSRAKCYKLFDMHRLVAVIENAFGDHLNFENEVLQIVQMRRGRGELRRASTGRGSFSFKNNATRRDSSRRESGPDPDGKQGGPTDTAFGGPMAA